MNTLEEKTELIVRMMAKIEGLEAENAQLLAALEDVEWVTNNFGIPVCPWCLSPREDGHDLCQRQQALAAGGE